MTLIVSLRTADGIVVAGDSLSTMRRQIEIKGDFDFTCPQCGHHSTVEQQPVGGINIPASTFSYAQKIFPFMGRFGVGTFGTGRLAHRTSYFAIRQLEEELRAKDVDPRGVNEAVDMIGEHAQELLQREHQEHWDDIPEGWRPVGFQVSGYANDEAVTMTAQIGKSIQHKSWRGYGCTKSGTGRAVQAIWQSYEKHPEDQAAYEAFSLQDAIDYARFLISTEASYQRFSGRIADVGGDVDVGLVTPYEDFTWIDQKPLGKILAGASSRQSSSGGDSHAQDSRSDA